MYTYLREAILRVRQLSAVSVPMKKVITVLVFTMVVVGCQQQSADDAANTTLELDTIEKKISYVVGYNTARQMKAEGFELDADAIAHAVRHLNAGDQALMSDDEMQAAMSTFQTSLQEKRQAQFSALSEENLKQGQAFLEDNGKRDGVITTASGLQYEVLSMGTGVSPAVNDQVTVNYKGSFVSGEIFDAGEGVSFTVSQLIPGWVEALPLMNVGSKWKLFVPPSLGYGVGGTGNIGPNTTLIFEMELVSIDTAVE